MKLTDQELINLYINDNIDTKTIAEANGVSSQAIRRRLRKLKIQKDHKTLARSRSARCIRKYNVRHYTHRPEQIQKRWQQKAKIEYIDKQNRTHYFRTTTELDYAKKLDDDNKEWYHREMIIPYIDAITGTWHMHVIDFTVINDDGSVEWVEASVNFILTDARVVVSRRAEESNIIYKHLQV